MKECDNCAYGGWLNGKDVITEICTECRYICGEPTKWKAKPMTNADRIRAMSDEELSVFLWEFEKEEIARATEYALERRKITEWLKQPADDWYCADGERKDNAAD